MYNTSDNPRVRQSLDALTQALFELMKTRSFEEIRVTEICRRAGLSSKTFYRNCLCRTDLIDYACTKEVLALFETVSWDSSDADLLFSNFLSFWLKKKEFLKLLELSGQFSRLEKVLSFLCSSQASYPFLSALLHNQKDPETVCSIHHSFVIGGLCAVLQEWTRMNFSTDPVVISSTLAAYVRVDQYLSKAAGRF